jgi:hypothetical protein
MRRLPLLCFALLFAAATALIAWLPGRLPERVAVHFDAFGHPNGYATREGCRNFMILATLAPPALVVALSLLARLLPAALINLPHREYWLAPERRAGTQALLAEQGVWFACLLLAFLAGMDAMLASANASLPPQFPNGPFTSAMALFAGAVAVWAIRSFLHFRRPPP